MSYITYQETFVMRKNSHWFENFVNFGFPYLLIAMLFLGVLIKTNYDD